jgi:hypothetical protein
MRSIALFVHGTSIDSRVWNSSVRSAVRRIFHCKEMEDQLELFSWCGSNNSGARVKASEELIVHIKAIQKTQTNPFQKIILIGHSHGGTILFKSIRNLKKELGDVEIVLVTLNTPRVIGGETMVDTSVDHFHIYCPHDLIVPRAGFNKTGIQFAGGETRTIWGSPKGGEFSRAKQFESGIHGTTSRTFDSALINIAYEDQYRHRGFNPKTHIVSHRGWLPKNVKIWAKILELAVLKYSKKIR